MDTIDQRLLALLRDDASVPLKTLAAQVGLSRSSVRDRIARMQSRGIIRRYTIEIAAVPAAAEPLTARCLLRLARTPDLAVVQALCALPEVRRCDALAGEIDLHVEIAAQNAATLNAVRDRIAAMPGVLEVTTHVVLHTYKSAQ